MLFRFSGSFRIVKMNFLTFFHHSTDAWQQRQSQIHRKNWISLYPLIIRSFRIFSLEKLNRLRLFHIHIIWLKSKLKRLVWSSILFSDSLRLVKSPSDCNFNKKIIKIRNFTEDSILFAQEVNDPYKNDETSNIDQKTLDALWELGAFGIQVPTGRWCGFPEIFLKFSILPFDIIILKVSNFRFNSNRIGWNGR